MCPPRDFKDDDPAPSPRAQREREKVRAATALTVRELILFEGPKLPPLSVSRIRRLGAAAVVPLIQTLTDNTLRDPSGPGASWGPVHAAKLLGPLRDPRALEPLLDVLATAPPPSELYTALVEALMPYRGALIDPVLARLPTAIGTYRRELWVLLANCKVRDPRVFGQLLAAFAEQPEEGAMRLGEYGDPAAMPYLTRALDAFRSRITDTSDDDRIVFELREAIEELGGTLTPSQRRKLEAARVTRMIESSMHTGPLAWLRNPGGECPCGSGLLYKQCCLQ